MTRTPHCWRPNASQKVLAAFAARVARHSGPITPELFRAWMTKSKRKPGRGKDYFTPSASAHRIALRTGIHRVDSPSLKRAAPRSACPRSERPRNASNNHGAGDDEDGPFGFEKEAQIPHALPSSCRPRGDEGLQADLELVREPASTFLSRCLRPTTMEIWASPAKAKLPSSWDEIHRVPDPRPNAPPSDLASFHALVANLRDQVRDGKTCWRSLPRLHRPCYCPDRFGDDCARLGCQPGLLQKIARARGFPVPDTPEQLEWILHFHPGP